VKFLPGILTKKLNQKLDINLKNQFQDIKMSPKSGHVLAMNSEITF
jgi:hypothetical protein